MPKTKYVFSDIIIYEILEDFNQFYRNERVSIRFLSREWPYGPQWFGTN